ncbi:general substrate transporter [Xylariomycetidae sp. FL0641]|nr:general substrate transporter [Xylariomycetidae sp. FL0641]
MPGLGSHWANIRRDFTRPLTCAVMLLCLSQFNFGFDIGVFMSIQAMDSFDKQFGWQDPQTGEWVLEDWWLSLFNSLQFIGYTIGIIAGSMVSKHYGRRWCVFVMSVLALAFAAILVTSKTRTQIIIGRVLNYIFIGMDLSVIPVFQAEIAPAGYRGLTVGTYQFVVNLGTLVSNGVARGTGSMQSNRAWQIPLALFFVSPTIVGSLIWFVPESPRWLVTRGRREEALRHLRRLRGGAFSEAQIAAEHAAICEMHDRAAGREQPPRLAEIFRRGPDRKRTALVTLNNVVLSCTGSNFASTYGAVYIKGLKTVNPFTVTTSTSAGVTVLCLLGVSVIDKVGRKKFPVIGGTIMAISMYTMAGLGTIKHQSTAVRNGIIAMMQLTYLGYGVFWSPVANITSAELPSTRLRDLTYRVAMVVNILSQFIITLILPYLIWEPAYLDSRVGFIFGTVCLLGVAFVVFCMPEVKGLSLEATDTLFRDRVHVWKFQEVGRQRMRGRLGEREITDEVVVDKDGAVHLETVRPAAAETTPIPAAEHAALRPA